MQNIFNYVRNNIKIIQKRMTIQINKHWKTIEYIENDYVFFDKRNIKIVKSSNKFDDKKFDFYKMLQRLNNVYRFELSQIMRIHDVFYCWLLRKNSCDSLEDQINDSLDFVIVNDFHQKNFAVVDSKFIKSIIVVS